VSLIKYSKRSLLDLERLADFLFESDPAASAVTADLIFDAISILKNNPEIGRKLPDGNRELVISRGRSGYVALYRFLSNFEEVLILAIRHQRESGYRS
jgi:plasmid stabilization system protein ParE